MGLLSPNVKFNKKKQVLSLFTIIFITITFFAHSIVKSAILIDAFMSINIEFRSTLCYYGCCDYYNFFEEKFNFKKISQSL